MPKLEIGFADGSELNFDQSFLQFNAKKQNTGKVLLNLNTKCWILNTASLNS